MIKTRTRPGRQGQDEQHGGEKTPHQPVFFIMC
jgi:hypothetical protein